MGITIYTFIKFSDHWLGEDLEGNIYFKTFKATTAAEDKEKLGWARGVNCGTF